MRGVLLCEVAQPFAFITSMTLMKVTKHRAESPSFALFAFNQLFIRWQQGSGPVAAAKWAFIAVTLRPWPAAALACRPRLAVALADALQTSSEDTLRCLFSCMRYAPA